MVISPERFLLIFILHRLPFAYLLHPNSMSILFFITLICNYPAFNSIHEAASKQFLFTHNSNSPQQSAGIVNRSGETVQISLGVHRE
jgi:hypothetical protein